MLGMKARLQGRRLVVAVLVAVVVSAAASSAPARADAAPGKGTVTGTVRKSDGSAGSAAFVRLVGRDEAERAGGTKAANRRKNAKAKWKGGGPRAVAQTTADMNGRFALADVPAGSYAILARLKGDGVARQFVTVRPGDTSHVSLTLEKPSGKRGVGKGGADDRRPKPGAHKAARSRRRRGD